MNEETQEPEALEEATAEESIEAPAPPKLTLDDARKMLKDAGEWPQAQAPAPQPQADFIPGTDIPKPPNYDGLELDAQMAFVASVTSQRQVERMHRTSRNARSIEAEAEDWYRPYVEAAIDRVNPDWLGGQLTDEDRKLVHQHAIGLAVMDKKLPPSQGKPLPGASPVSTTKPTGTVPSETEQLLRGLKDAGYGLVADDKRIQELLSK